MAVDPALAAEFPWLKTDPAPILGDSRPRTAQALFDKAGIWLQLMHDWVGAKHADHVEGLNYISKSQTDAAGYTAQLTAAYQEFYGVAGRMKDFARKDPRGVRERYRWAPADAKALLGEARPKTFEALLDEGPTAPWYGVFLAWLVDREPFEKAAQWLPWLVGLESQTAGWMTSINAIMPAFVEEIELLKKALRDNEGTMGTASRRLRQVGEAVGEVKTKLDQGVDKVMKMPLVPGGEAPKKQTAPEPKKDAPPPVKKQLPPAKKAPPPVPPRSKVPGYIGKQLGLATPLLEKAADYTGWVSWLSGRFGGFGGGLGQQAGTLMQYKGMVEEDILYVTQQTTALATHLRTGDDATLFALLAAYRGAVYRLAWNIDLALRNQLAGWPHDCMWDIVGAVGNSTSAQLRFDGGRALHRLLSDIESVYDRAAGVLDIAKQIVDDNEIPGYVVQDGAEPWSVHQVVMAKDEVAGLLAQAGELAGQQPQEEEDVALVDEAALQTFGVPHQNLLQHV